MNARWFVAACAATAASLAIVAASAPPSLAQEKMGTGKMTHSGKMSGSGGKMMSKKMDKSMYCCQACKMCFSSTDAHKMHMKDPMGHKLTKMAKMPAGYKMGKAGAPMMHGDHKMMNHQGGNMHKTDAKKPM
jgi:hypothetical protein